MEYGNNIITLTEEQLNHVVTLGDIHNFTRESVLYYKGQTPVVAYLVIQGEVRLYKDKSCKQTLTRGSLFGLKELVGTLETNEKAMAALHSKICFIGLSTINELSLNGRSLKNSMLMA